MPCLQLVRRSAFMIIVAHLLIALVDCVWIRLMGSRSSGLRPWPPYRGIGGSEGRGIVELDRREDWGISEIREIG